MATSYNLEEVIKELNLMVENQVVDSYAIGGAIAASFYGEVATTEDVDVFVAFRRSGSSLLIDPSPLIHYFLGRGYSLFEDKVVIGGWPVQFLPPPTALEEEALDRAIELQDGGLKLKLFSREYTAAIALATGRAKDRSRLIQLRDEGELDMSEFQRIVTSHGLLSRWEKFQEQFPPEMS